MHSQLRPQRRRAFTLIELLVVVAIISLLISILLPSLKTAKDKARTAVCGANLKGIGTAVRACYTENRDYGPSWDDGEFDNTDGFIMYTWVDVLFDLDYLGDTKSGICPTDLRPDAPMEIRGETWRFGFVDEVGLNQDTKPGVRTSYALNNIMHFNYKRDRWTQDSSRQIYAMDGWWNWFGSVNAAWAWLTLEYGVHNGSVDNPLNFPDLFGTMVGWRHGSSGEFSANSLFVDGHVKLLTASRRPSLNDLRRGMGRFDTSKAFTWIPGELPTRKFYDYYKGEIEEYAGGMSKARKPFRYLVDHGNVAHKWIGSRGGAPDFNNVFPSNYPEELSPLWRTQRNAWRKLPANPGNRN